MTRDVFSSYHPLVNLCYFVLVLLCTMCFWHPVILLISFGSAAAYAMQLNDAKKMKQQVMGLLPVMLIAAVLNPMFNHKGATVLTYLPSGNPLTLESLLYGLAAAVMLAAVILWFACYTVVMTSDKFIYLFGRIIPALSLVLSMILRFIPRCQVQLVAIREAQSCIGRSVHRGTVWQRMRCAVQMVSILVTWAMEQAIETADSMRSRGYGLTGRTAFSIYRFEKRDKLALLCLAGGAAVIAVGWRCGVLAWSYYPLMQGKLLTPLSMIVQTIYLTMCMTPVILNRREVRLWMRLQSSR